MLSPLTILAGANSAGKSSAMQALLLLKQTIDAMPLDAGALRLDKPNVHFTNAEQLLSHEPGQAAHKEFHLRCEFSDRSAVAATYQRTGHTLDVLWTEYTRGDRVVRLKKGAQTTVEEIGSVLRGVVLGSDYQANAPIPVVRWASFLVPGPDSSAYLPSPVLLPPISTLSRVLQALIHIPGSRGNPLRTFPRTVAGKNSPGVFTELAPALLADWTSAKAPELEQVNESLVRLGLTWKAEARVLDAANIEIRVARTAKPFRGSAQDFVNIADVGFGVSQILPILVALVAAARGQIIYVEQPEIHLHPRAVMTLADLICDASRRGVRCVIETHSDVLLRRIQWNIARSDTPLHHSDVVFHWFHRDPKGHAHVDSVVPDASGAYGEWPVDFAEIDAQNAREYIAAAERHLPEE